MRPLALQDLFKVPDLSLRGLDEFFPVLGRALSALRFLIHDLASFAQMGAGPKRPWNASAYLASVPPWEAQPQLMSRFT